MMRKTCGRWTIEATSYGVTLMYQDKTVTAWGQSVEDLRDLRYLVERALADLEERKAQWAE